MHVLLFIICVIIIFLKEYETVSYGKFKKTEMVHCLKFKLFNNYFLYFNGIVIFI